MGSALLDDPGTATRTPAESVRDSVEAAHGQSAASNAMPGPALRRQAAERVAAHRTRRMAADSAGRTELPASPRNTRSAKIAAAVAERYAQAQSYRDFLATEAQRAVQQAQAAADVAAMNAQAVAAAQRDLLDAIDRVDAISEDPGEGQETSSRVALLPIEESSSASSITPYLWQELEPEVPSEAKVAEANPRKFQPPQSRRKPIRQSDAPERPEAREPVTVAAVASTPDPLPAIAGGITIRLYQDEAGATRVTLDPPAPPVMTAPVMAHRTPAAQNEEEALLLDEEIAFRQEPAFDEPFGPAEPLPANLIEFPRQLVATRKARPRLAEGPLRAEVEDVPGDGQLRIFEVVPEQIAVTPVATDESDSAPAAQWSSILLESRPRGEGTSVSSEAAAETATQAVTPSLLNIAPLERRLLAAGINMAIVGAACIAFIAVFLWTAAHAPFHSDLMSSTVAGIARGLVSRAAIQSALPLMACAFALLTFIYEALFFTLSTATPGMRVARIALCTFNDENPTRRAVRRRLPALLLSALPLGFGFLWAALDEERLTWHDRICGIYQRSY